uniref:NADPH-dependent diflavin oxidoreductase 1 n=1 Tax=Plectus sambesii TaxID=2011161 RepID=A0A914WPS0_9BILA
MPESSGESTSEDLLQPSLVILFGSETGNAQDVAECLWRDCRRRHFACRLLSMDDYNVTDLPDEQLIILIASTTGQGEEPSNMRSFWRFLLRRSLPLGSLARVKMAVFGLGDSSYQKYNFAAKKLFRRLAQLGASAVVPLGLADDQHDLGVDGAFQPWREQLWTAVDALYPAGSTIISDDELLPPKFKVEWIDALTTLKAVQYAPPPCFVPVLENVRVTSADHFQDTRLIKFDISDFEEAMQYHPGDVLMVQPRNLAESVGLATEALGYDDSFLERRFTLTPTDPNILLPSNWLLPRSGATVRQCFENYFDLQCVPRRSFFVLLAALSTDELEKEKLQELCMAENQQDMYDYCNRPRRTVAETLRDFNVTARSIPFQYLFDLLSPIRPRAFSLASCPQTHQGEVHILVAIVEYKTRLSIKRQGLCSTFLSRLNKGEKVWTWMRKGTFRWPEDPSSHVVLVGPGTGVAPFRSFAHFRHSSQASGQVFLFFGCRYEEKDFYFKTEWMELPKLTLVTAFSREDPAEKVYVQHRIENQGETIWRLISEENGHLFVAGNADQMPKDVIQCLKNIAAKYGGVTDVDAFVEKLEKSGRLQFETWS